MMNSLRSCLGSFFRGSFRPDPCAGWEVLIMRVLFACVVWQTFPENFPYAEQKFPNGIARMFDLTWLWSGHSYQIGWLGISEPCTAMQLVRACVGICLVIYATGYLLPLVLPVLTVASILVRTYYNSQGSIHHGCQMVTLILLFQTIVVLWFAGRRLWGWHRGKPLVFEQGQTVWSYLVYHSIGAIAGCYVIAGLTKIVRTGGAWFWNSPYMALEVMKTEKQQYYSTLDTSRVGTQGVYAEWLLDYPNLARIILGGGVVLELLAIFMLWNRKLAITIGLSMILFHRIVDMVMDLHFRFNEYVVWIFCVNVPIWAVLCLRKGFGLEKASNKL